MTLTASHALCAPKARLMPGNGLSRLNFGMNIFAGKWMPPCAAAAATPSTMSPIASGATAIAASVRPRWNSSSARSGSGFAASVRPWRNSSGALSIAEPSALGTRKLASSMPAHAPRSGVRAI